MNRRHFIKLAGLGSGALMSYARFAAAMRTPAKPEGTPARPNFLFLVSDDQSVPDLGCYGNSAIHTPNLDAMAGEGMRFESGFVTSPSCSPSRSSIVTGRSAHATGTARLHAPLPANQKTFLEGLKSQGYFTGAFRKVHLGDGFWKRWDFEGRHKEFSTFFDARPKDRPFFLHVGFHDPHRPYWPHEYSPPHDPTKVPVPGFLPDTLAVRKDLAHYYDEIARMDRNVGKILALLERDKLAENTLVIFTSDNGLPFPGAKGTLYDPGLHVPMIARWPGVIKPGRVSSHLISLIDLAPTWLEAAGLPVPEIMEGRSFLPLLQEKDYKPREAIYAERNYHTHLDLIRCVRTHQYKLIQNFLPERPYRPTSDLARSPSWHSIQELRQQAQLNPDIERRLFTKPRPKTEFYDLAQDPGETRNLAEEPASAETVKQLQLRLSHWMVRTNDFLPPPIEILDEDYKDENQSFND
jgi:N-sulfoglucosamine sulfohydrolase